MSAHDDVLRKIEHAFANARMPRTEAALAEPGIEAPYVIEHFLGKTQAALEAARFPGSLYMEDFSYMTDEAVLYYLPSVLRIMLASAHDGELWIFVYGFLQHVHGKYPESGLTNLDAAQRAAIAGWAMHLAHLWEDDEWMSGCAVEAAVLADKYCSLG